MSSTIDKLRDVYNRSAPDYDTSRYEDHPSKRLYLRVANESYIHNIPHSSPLRILDFATGTGRLSLVLGNSNHELISVDISEEMIRIAKRKVSQCGGAKISFCMADGLSLPFAPNTFDYVVASKFFHLIDHQYHSEFLRELFRVLKPHGRIVADFNNIIFWIFLKLFRGMWRQKEFFYNPMQKYTLYKHWNIVGIRGHWMPFSFHVFKFSETCFDWYNMLAIRFPFKYVCSKLVIVFEKAPGKAGD